MRGLVSTVVAAIAVVAPPWEPSPRAADSACGDPCLVLAQYGSRPEQEYQERLQRYREQYDQNLRQYQKEREMMQGPGRGPAFGAIAYSPKSGDYGYSFGYSSRAGAEQRAKQECGQGDCEIAAWFSNACGALAVGDDGTWAGGNGNSERRAREDAQSDCVKEGGKNCQVLFSRCSR